MNLPGHRIHDCSASYARLIAPLPFTGRWLIWADEKGFRLTDGKFGFHNCTRTGVY